MLGLEHIMLLNMIFIRPSPRSLICVATFHNVLVTLQNAVSFKEIYLSEKGLSIPVCGYRAALESVIRKVDKPVSGEYTTEACHVQSQFER